MIRVESPAKVNLTLLVSPPGRDGYHPLDSIVQTIEWCDHLEFDHIDDGKDRILISGADLDPEDNLVARAMAAVRGEKAVPPYEIRLAKEIPMQAGLGGGSSNAAATLVAVGGDLGRDSVARLARSLGSDVPLFLSGGSQWMRGTGESLEPWPPLSGFAVAVVVPPFGFDTAEVYRRWDELEGPMGEPLPSDRVPPALRELTLRNDLLPAALNLEPLLGDFLADLRALWGTPVSMTGSGSACFGYFATLDEAEDAASSVSDLTRAGRGVELRDRGVKASDHHDG